MGIIVTGSLLLREFGPKPVKPARPKRCGIRQSLKDFSRPRLGHGLSLRHLGALCPFFDVLPNGFLVVLARQGQTVLFA